MSAIAKAGYFWRSAAQGLRYAPFVHFIAVLTLAIALFTAGLARGGGRMLDALIATFGADVELTVYLDRGVDPARAEKLAREVEKRVGGPARLVTPEVALGRLTGQLGELGRTLEDLPENPLPSSIEVRVPPEVRTLAALAQLSDSLRLLEAVDSVDYGAEAVARLSALARALRWGGLIGFLVIVGATVVIISATLQLAIYSRREEIEIQKLVGATDRFVQVPFLLEGIFQGVFGTALALIALVVFSTVAAPFASGALAFFLPPNSTVPLVDARLALELLVVGVGLGLIGSFVAVARFSRV